MTNYRAAAAQLENEFGIPAGLLQAVITNESAWNPTAGSPAGAYGLAQLMPGTAASLGVNINDPLSNLRGGAMYLSQMLKGQNGNIERALAAYNAGPGAVAQYNGIPPYSETQNYIKKVMGTYQSGGGNAANGLTGASGGMIQTDPGVPGPSNSWIAKMNAYFMDAPEIGSQLIQNRINKAQPPSYQQAPGTGIGTGTAGPNPGGFEWQYKYGEPGSFRDLIKWGAQYGAQPTSTQRPGDTDSRHGQDRAVDFGTSTTSPEEMAAMYAYAMAHPNEFDEFYVPSFVGNQHIEDGQVVNGVYPDHEDHIHAARDKRDKLQAAPGQQNSPGFSPTRPQPSGILPRTGHRSLDSAFNPTARPTAIKPPPNGFTFRRTR